jgi:cystathionine gamma-lyase
LRFDTKALHAGQPPDPQTGAVNVPVYLTSTYAQISPGVTRGYDYSRTVNPTRRVLEKVLAELESGREGLAFSSGMGALTTLLWTLKAGSRILASEDVYGGTYRLFEHARRTWGFRVEYLDLRDPGRLAGALEKEGADLIYVETPTNPLLTLVDLQEVGRLARQREVPLVVDNTFATPYFQNPLRWGAQVVLHSTTKYLNGHSDVVGGALVTDEPERGSFLRYLQNAAGAVPGPLDCFLVLRGIHTLGLRMRAHAQNAQEVAETLEASAKVTRVSYPGLPSHPQHALASRQMSGFGGMVSCVFRGGLEAARKFVSRLEFFTLGESLGGVESLVEIPAVMTHESIPAEVRRSRGLEDGLVRLSVGVEDGEDLVEDVQRALEGI